MGRIQELYILSCLKYFTSLILFILVCHVSGSVNQIAHIYVSRLVFTRALRE